MLLMSDIKLIFSNLMHSPSNRVDTVSFYHQLSVVSPLWNLLYEKYFAIELKKNRLTQINNTLCNITKSFRLSSWNYKLYDSYAIQTFLWMYCMFQNMFMFVNFGSVCSPSISRGTTCMDRTIL